ncbi:MAG TPA: hypothetical protein DEO84_03140 [candidate division Zixibacteria bacterium]|nr:hypothetical protein [candidate division Zixibacteria bacterium]
MKNILKNKLFAASIMFLLLNLAGAFLMMAPLLVLLRNRFDHSQAVFSLWPVISPLMLADILVNDTQMVATFVIAGIVIFALYMLLCTYFSGGIYSLIVLDKEPEAAITVNPFKDFLVRSAQIWPGFIKVSLFSIVIYLIAIFIGGIVSKLASPMGIFWQAVSLIFFLLIASTYIQILKVRFVVENSSSVTQAIRSSRQAIAKSAARLVIGNLAVAIVGVIAALILWTILKWVRSYDWNIGLAVLSIVLEQAIILVLCLMQVIRINYNHITIKRGV